MKHLSKHEEIIITTAYKGSAVVIMDTENYIKGANRQLSDKNNCKTLQTNPTLQHNKVVNNTLDRFKSENLLFRKTAERLKAINLKTPTFCIISKIHKENNPERPVINSIDCHTSEISRFVNHYLQPLVKEIPSYIKDINDFVSKINNVKVTMNVKALYTNKARQLHKENCRHKSDNNILGTYFDTKQLHL